MTSFCNLRNNKIQILLLILTGNYVLFLDTSQALQGGWILQKGVKCVRGMLRVQIMISHNSVRSKK